MPRAFNINAKQISLELHQETVLGRTTIDPKHLEFVWQALQKFFDNFPTVSVPDLTAIQGVINQILSIRVGFAL